MTVAERLRLTTELMEFADAALAALDPAVRERRLAIAHAQTARSNDAIESVGGG